MLLETYKEWLNESSPKIRIKPGRRGRPITVGVKNQFDRHIKEAGDHINDGNIAGAQKSIGAAHAEFRKAHFQDPTRLRNNELRRDADRNRVAADRDKMNELHGAIIPHIAKAAHEEAGGSKKGRNARVAARQAIDSHLVQYSGSRHSEPVKDALNMLVTNNTLRSTSARIIRGEKLAGTHGKGVWGEQHEYSDE